MTKQMHRVTDISCFLQAKYRNHVAKLVKQTAALKGTSVSREQCSIGDTNVRGLSSVSIHSRRSAMEFMQFQDMYSRWSNHICNNGNSRSEQNSKANITVADVTNSNGRYLCYDGSSFVTCISGGCIQTSFMTDETLDTTACAFELFKKSQQLQPV